MHEMLDMFDQRILAALQRDARLTNSELSLRVILSPSQCSRRRARLEAQGHIKGYFAALDRRRLGLDVMNIVTVTLHSHNPDNAVRFAALVERLPEVLEVYALTGEMDYMLKVVTRDLSALSDFVNGVLLPHEAVHQVKSAIIMQTLKETHALPVPGSGP